MIRKKTLHIKLKKIPFKKHSLIIILKNCRYYVIGMRIYIFKPNVSRED